MTATNPEIALGCGVKMHFSLTLSDGTEVLSTYQDSPLEFVMGDGTMEPLLEYALIGLHSGDEQSLEVSGDEVYGAKDEANIHWIERSVFPADLSLEESQIIAFTTEQGEETPGIIQQIDGERVLVDFNHPLSGRSFQYKVSILSVESAE
ncbi:MAG: FKBP-type peptidyl-prolyl cis-trans isomerase [Candidatus Thiodiazotropha sp. 6PLUC2]